MALVAHNRHSGAHEAAKPRSANPESRDSGFASGKCRPRPQANQLVCRGM